MKKYLFLIVLATTLVACGSELEDVYNQYEEISAAKDEKEKQDPNFRIFNDHFQKGKTNN